MDTGPMGPRRGEPARTVVTGPLAPYAEGWRAELAARGFARHSVLAHAQLMAHLSGWMMSAGHGVGSLTGEVIGDYLDARRAAGSRARGGRALVPLLCYLRGLGVVPQPVAVPATPAEALLAEFCGYLAGERGLAAVTAGRYARFARVLITGLGITSEADLAAVTAADIAAFTVSQASRRNPADMQGLVTAVRSLLRVPARHGQGDGAAGRGRAVGARPPGNLASARDRSRAGSRAAGVLRPGQRRRPARLRDLDPADPDGAAGRGGHRPHPG